ncbi:MAG: hypothetical protein ABR542_11010, partial [Desulfonatronovibrio sp.]
VEIANPAAGKLGYDQGLEISGSFFTREIIRHMRKKIMPSKLFDSKKQEAVSVDAHGKSWDIYLNAAGPDSIIFVAVDVTWRIHLEKLRDDVERITKHDLKTPLNGIISIPEILLESPNLSEEDRELI